MEEYKYKYRYNKENEIIWKAIELYMSSVEFREFFNKELTEYMHSIDEYTNFDIVIQHSKETITFFEYFKISLVDKEKNFNNNILNINRRTIHNYEGRLDLLMFSKIILRDWNIEKILK